MKNYPLTTYRVTGDTSRHYNKLKKAGLKKQEDGSWIGDIYTCDSIFRYEGTLTFKEYKRPIKEEMNEKIYDEIFNEGGDGFNPYRSPSKNQ